MLECLLFDMDGLLIDSDPLQFGAYRKAFAEFGYDLDIGAWTRWHEVEASCARFVAENNIGVDAAEVRARKKELYDRLIEEELVLKPGASKLVEDCATEFRLALVSGSRLESIQACLEKFGLLQHFDVLVSGADQKRSKPYPDAYLAGMQRLDTSPKHAIALEDSPSGFRAAVAADLRCLVCPDDFRHGDPEAFEGAALIVSSLEEVDPDLLRGLL